MRHAWIFDVLTDLRAYALANGLPALAAKTEETLAVARAEIAAQDTPDEPPPGGLPPAGRAH
ncbi:MAG: hypothetical protein IE927_03695 [Rhodobacterales bacterium]|nr:hypothetical protein [Rhodobacterales bacterium]